MVNDAGQLYTMEGVAAGIIMLVTAYIVVSTTSVYTPGDTHIPDMQLEQLGSDALAMMDVPDKKGGESRLLQLVWSWNGTGLRDEFLDACMIRTGINDTGLQAQVYLSYRTTTGSVNTTQLSPTYPDFTGRENAVRVTRWVHLPSISGTPPSGMPTDMPIARTPPPSRRPQTALVEVLLWRA